MRNCWPLFSAKARRGALFLPVFLLSVCAPSSAQSVSFTEYPLATGSSPVVITPGPDGALWFTENAANKIGRITTAGAISEYPVPTATSGPFGISSGPDGALWFTEANANKIGRITTAGAISEYTITAADGLDIAAGADGALWFSEQAANKIGRITTAGAISEYTVPTPHSALGSITAGPDGALWFAEQGGNKIGRITTAGVISEYAVPTPFGEPVGITAGPDGALWFTEYQASTIGRVALALFTGSVYLGSGVNYLQFPDGSLFGYYNFPASSILYHYDMGFEAFIPGSGSDVYFYDFTSGHWWYTSSALFPYLYDFSLNTWIYYFPDTTNPGHYTSNPRYFSNLTTGKIFTM